MHRDLKPENIVLRKVTNVLYEPVLIDFGLAEFEKKEPFVFTRCGTPGFIAP
jgi:calcium-dependent protein kinase